MKRLRLMTIVGTRPEIIRLSEIIKCCDVYFDQLLVHTGQNYDDSLSGVFFRDLQLRAPDVYLNAAAEDLGQTMGNIIAKSYQLMCREKPDAVLVLGDTNSCLSVIGAKRLHIPIFHMEAGNRCKDECLPEETNRRAGGRHQRRESLLLGAGQKMDFTGRNARRTYLCGGIAHGRGAP